MQYHLVLASEDVWEPDFAGVFLRSDSRLCFAHRRRKSVVISVLEENPPEAAVIETSKIDLPADWLLMNKGSLLMHSEHQGIDLRTMQCRAVTDELFCREYRNQKASRCLHLVNDDFAFGDRTISHHKACGFICRNAGREEWKINCRGYLYTNILPCHDCVLFGTAGMGGHFYAVELSSGAIKCDVNTGGTGSFILSGENVYLLSRGSKDSKLLEISTDTWKIREECTIAGTVSSYSRLALEGDLLYAVSFRYKGNLPRQAYMNVIKIG